MSQLSIYNKGAIQDYMGQSAAPSNPPSSAARAFYNSTTNQWQVVDTNGNNIVVAGAIVSGTAITAPSLLAPTMTGGLANVQIATPGNASAVVTGSAGSNWTYKLVAVDQFGFETLASSGVTASAAATLNGSNFITLTAPTLPVGAVSFLVYRTASGGTPASTGIIGTIATSGGTLVDNALVGDGSTVPLWNMTGQVLGGIGVNVAASQFMITPFPEGIFGTQGGGVLAGNAQANVLKVTRMHCTRTVKVNRVTIDVTTNVGGSTANIGIYRADGGRKLFDVTFSTNALAVVTSTTTGVAGFAFPFTFYAGAYYIVATSSTATTTTGTGVTIGATNGSVAFLNAVNVHMGFAANSTSGAVMPATTGAFTTLASTQALAIWEP